MKLCVIPARGGSKRIPRKNIKPFAGLPMLVHSLRAAQASGCFDRILISSDDPEILACGAAYGAESLVRPAELADDHTPTIPVIRHAIEVSRNQGQAPDAVCCIYATAPFIRADDLQRGAARLAVGDMDFAFTATSFGFPVFRGFLREGEGVRMLYPEHFGTRSQDLPEVFHDAGQFYWGTPEAWLSATTLFGPRSAPILLPRWQVQDIDTPEDWQRAELMHQAWFRNA
jgi:N-acylneuraminate cytidylyltransferase